MTKTCITLMATAAALFVTVAARKEFVKLIPNGANVNGIVALGHADGTGESEDLDAFGTAFAKAGNKWTTALCKADSDGDGQTNGEELGDPCCVWTQGSTPKFTSGASNPGDASMKVTASVLEKNSCTATTTAPTAAPTTAPKTSAPTSAPSSAPAATPGKAGSSSAPAPTSATPSTSAPSSTVSETSAATVAPSNATESTESSSSTASDSAEYASENTTTSVPSGKSSSTTTTPSPSSSAMPVRSAIAASVVAGLAAFALW